MRRVIAAALIGLSGTLFVTGIASADEWVKCTDRSTTEAIHDERRDQWDRLPEWSVSATHSRCVEMNENPRDTP